MLQLIDVVAGICQDFYTATIPVYIHNRGLRRAFLGVVMQNNIERVAGTIVVRFSIL